MDPSNGYESVSKDYILYRGSKTDGIGASTVLTWANTFKHPASILDIGCGTGIPITKILIDRGFDVYGIDASPSLVNEFHRNFPETPVECESALASRFFDRQFDAVIACGLLFLLTEKDQFELILKLSNSLVHGGRALFTAPIQEMQWNDVMTGLPSISLGKSRYDFILSQLGFSILDGFVDEGDNYYHHAIKNDG